MNGTCDTIRRILRESRYDTIYCCYFCKKAESNCNEVCKPFKEERMCKPTVVCNSGSCSLFEKGTYDIFDN